MIHILIITIDYSTEYELFNSHELAFAALIEKIKTDIVQRYLPGFRVPDFTTEQEARKFESDNDLGINWILEPLFGADQVLMTGAYQCPASVVSLLPA